MFYYFFLLFTTTKKKCAKWFTIWKTAQGAYSPEKGEKFVAESSPSFTFGAKVKADRQDNLPGKKTSICLAARESSTISFYRALWCTLRHLQNWGRALNAGDMIRNGGHTPWGNVSSTTWFFFINVSKIHCFTAIFRSRALIVPLGM